MQQYLQNRFDAAIGAAEQRGVLSVDEYHDYRVKSAEAPDAVVETYIFELNNKKAPTDKAPLATTQTPDVQKRFEAALLAAKMRGAIDLQAYANYRKTSATASDSDLEQAIAKLNKDKPAQPVLSPSASVTTRTLFSNTLSKAAELGVVRPSDVSSYRAKAAEDTEEKLLGMISDLEDMIKRKM